MRVYVFLIIEQNIIIKIQAFGELRTAGKEMSLIQETGLDSSRTRVRLSLRSEWYGDHKTDCPGELPLPEQLHFRARGAGGCGR